LYWQIVQVINDIQPQIIHAQAGKAASLLRCDEMVVSAYCFCGDGAWH
jgi:hypothetical protein